LSLISSSRYGASLLLFVLLSSQPGRADDKPIVLKSPNGRIVVTIQSGDHLSYSATFQGHPVLATSALGVTVNGTDMGAAVSFDGSPSTQEINEHYPDRGVHSQATNHYLASVISLTSGPARTSWQLEVRVFNDAIAYQYRIPDESGQHIDGESSSWNVPTGSTLWSQDASNRAYESKFSSSEVGKIPVHTQVMAPATLQLPDDAGYMMMTEANLINYSDMDLQVTGATTFQALFYDSPHGWTQHGDLITPWRVTVITKDLNGLVNTDVIKNLCPPPSDDLANATWIKPGRTIWHWLTVFHPKLPDQHDWIDGTAAIGYEYYLIDDGWKDWNGGGQNAWDAMADCVRYADSKNVKLWAWLNAHEVVDPEKRKAYFEKAKSIGLVGLKIDFPDPPDPTWVQWYDDTLKDAARYQLMVDLHGAVKPTGRDRTWPQELSREGVAGREQGKNSATHDTALPFVRFVQGHADYTPTLLEPNQLNGSSLAHEFAMAIVFTSDFLCLADNPKVYLASTGADVFKALSSVWDETVVLPESKIGSTAAFARRHGRDWFIGIINGPQHTGTVSLSFLGTGTYKIVELADDPETNNAMVRTEKKVTSKDTLTIPLRNDGGFVAWLTPQ
jgi:alpha-glucosidase